MSVIIFSTRVYSLWSAYNLFLGSINTGDLMLNTYTLKLGSPAFGI